MQFYYDRYFLRNVSNRISEIFIIPTLDIIIREMMIKFMKEHIYIIIYESRNTTSAEHSKHVSHICLTFFMFYKPCEYSRSRVIFVRSGRLQPIFFTPIDP